MLHEYLTPMGGHWRPFTWSWRNLWFKNEQKSNLDCFFKNKGRTFYMYMYIMRMNGGYSQGGRGAASFQGKYKQ